MVGRINELCGLSSLPVIQIRHKSIVQYYEPLNRRSILNNRRTWENRNLYKTAYSGKVTQGVRKRLTKAINIMLQVAKPKTIFNEIGNYYQYHKLSFITLKITADKVLSAREAYDNCFSHFLDWLKRTATNNQNPLYVWKLEPQADGQVHYHITTPEWINCRKIKDKWNAILRKAGYLTKYAQEHGHYNANSTDVHQVNDVQNLSSYMVKALTDCIAAAEKIKINKRGKKAEHIGAEMAKDMNNEYETEGKIWGCSEILSNAKYATLLLGTRAQKMIDQLVAMGRVKMHADEQGFWAVYHFTDCSPPDVLSKNESTYITDFLSWQMQKPAKGSNSVEIDQWEKAKPAYCSS